LKKDRNQNGIPIKEAIDGYFKALGMEDKMHETRVLSQWEALMGEAVSKRTEGLFIRDRILYVELNSSVMRDELQQAKTEIIAKINELAGMELITDIFLK
jgi:predicted nucleic acid-binding Zn ribbon protein